LSRELVKQRLVLWSEKIQDEIGEVPALPGKTNDKGGWYIPFLVVNRISLHAFSLLALLDEATLFIVQSIAKSLYLV
jgi:hypothetical protein